MLIPFFGENISVITLIVNWCANKIGIHVRSKRKGDTDIKSIQMEQAIKIQVQSP